MSQDKLAIKLGSKAALQKKLFKYLDRIEDLEGKVTELLHGELEAQGMHTFGMGLGVHECEPSPFGLCVYDTVDDPARDHCVFCGDPHERK